MEKELGSKLTYLRDAAASGRAAAGARRSGRAICSEAEAAVAAIGETRAPGRGRISARRCFDELSKGRAEGARARAQDLIKAEQRTRLQLLTAPGRRHGAAARDPHGRRRGHAGAGPACGRAERQPPRNRGDGAPTATSASSQPGQDAEIKVDTFNFTRYGLLHGDGAQRLAGRRHPRPAGRTAPAIERSGRRTTAASRRARS